MKICFTVASPDACSKLNKNEESPIILAFPLIICLIDGMKYD